MKKIKSALISVYYKDGLERIVRKLAEDGVAIYSTGGTLSFIESLGLKATSVESLTGYPSILGGRVKTLHPKVFGGILARRDNPKDSEQAAQYEIPEIDAVIVDLYPFEQTVASGAPEQDVIEKIDIGGISLIRAAAKNFKDVVIVPSVDQYAEFFEIIDAQHQLYDARAAPPFRGSCVQRQLALRHGHLQLFQPSGEDRLVQAESDPGHDAALR